ncbi:MAG: AAA family ATPase, partial [bacterium]
MHVCIECGYSSPDWLGRCPNCGEFGTLEKREPVAKKKTRKNRNLSVEPRPLQSISSEEYRRIETGISELDRVLGGGLVPGSVILLGGQPGIGKSTLLLQWGASRVQETPVLYVNGEESGPQVARRARRLGVPTENIKLIPSTNIEAVINTISELDSSLVFIDSIQTMVSEDSSGMPGSMAQLRAVTQKVVAAAKKHTVSFLLVGHVTKQGDIGGPKRLEHMVDTVLYFDEATRGYRFIRSAKNRFG